MPARRLLAMGLVVFVVGAVLANWPQGDGAPLDLGQVVRMRSGFLGSLGGNAAEWTADLPDILGYLPVTLGGMMIGLGLFHAGYLKGEARGSTYVLAVVAAALGLLGVAWAVRAGTPWEPMINGLLCLPVTLGYAGVLILTARSGWGRVVLYPLACAGRMAFTNYLCQSLIMTAIFYGGRGPGLFGSLAHAELIPIVAAIWVGQLVFSTLWIRWFRYGPFEWLWRSLSYGKRLAISKKAYLPL
jgi:uncharacterized protein